MNQQHLVQIQQVTHKHAMQPGPAYFELAVQVIINPITIPLINHQKV